jgi:hypothetical protein
MEKPEEFIREDILMLKGIGEEPKHKLKNGRGENLHNTVKERIFKSTQL